MKQILVFERLQRARPSPAHGRESGAIYSLRSRFRSKALYACLLACASIIGLLGQNVSAAGVDNKLPGASLEEVRRVADEGNAEVQYKLGKICEEGLGLPQDAKEAAKWYLKAAQQGYPQAQYKMGALYTLGKGVPKDPVEAAKWFGRATQQGYGPARLQIQETITKLKDQLWKDPFGLLRRMLGA